MSLYGTHEQEYDCTICRSGFEKERDEAFAAGAASKDAEIEKLKALLPPLTEEIADAFIEGAKQEGKREIAELKAKITDLEGRMQGYESVLTALKQGQGEVKLFEFNGRYYAAYIVGA